MQYRLPKKRFLPILLIGALVAAILSFCILSRLNTPLALFFPYVAAVLFAAILFLIGRFLVFGTLYHLGEAYTDLTFTVYRTQKTASTPIARIELCGNEALILLDKQGKKAIRNKKKLGVYTANLIPDGYYALTCEIDGAVGYILLELNDYAKNALTDRIARAKAIYAIDQT